MLRWGLLVGVIGLALGVGLVLLGGRSGDAVVGPRAQGERALGAARVDAERGAVVAQAEAARTVEAKAGAREVVVGSEGASRLEVGARTGNFAEADVRVRVRDQGGRLLGGDELGGAARLHVQRWSESEGWSFAASEVADAAGVFRFTFQGAARFVFEAKLGERQGVGLGDPVHGALGTAAGRALSDVFDLDARDGDRELELELVGEGVLRGQVVDVMGRGIPGLGLTTARGIGGAFAVERPTERWSRDANQGLHVAQTATDVDGRFAIDGLAPGSYDLYMMADRYTGWGASLNAQPLATGGGPYRLMLEQDGIYVRVLTADGVASANVRPADAYRGRERSVAEGVLVIVEELGGAAWDAPKGLVSGWVGGQGAVGFVGLEPGRYRVAAVGRDFGVVAEVVELVAGVGQHDVELRLPAARTPGTLRIEVRDGDGERLEVGVRVRLLDVATGQVLLEGGGAPFETVLEEVVVPAGSYWLDVQSVPRFNSLGTELYVRSHGAERRRIEVPPAGVVEERFQLDDLCRLLVRVVGVPAVAPPLAGPQVAEGEEADLARIWVRRPGEPWDAVDFFHSNFTFPGSKAQRASDQIFNHVRLGDERLSEPLAPGQYELQAQLPDGRRATQTVDLFAGRTTPVTLVFDS